VNGSGPRTPQAGDSGTLDWFATLAANPRPRPHDLRFRRRRSAPSQLLVLALDASASMLRGGALATAKGVVHACQQWATRAGTHTALIRFRGSEAVIDVLPRASPLRFARSLVAIGAAGGTPTRQALALAATLAEHRAWKDARTDKKLVLLTDGRSREALSGLRPRLERAGLETLVVDCEATFVRLGGCRRVASELGAHLVSLVPVLA